MTSRINFTGRKRITRDRVDVQVERAQGSLLATISHLGLDGLGLPDHAQLFVEVYHQTFFHRFQCGTVSAPDLPKESGIADFAAPELLHSRVRVVAVDGSQAGQLLALADRLPVSVIGGEGKSRGLLPVGPGSLGSQFWKMDITGDYPQILINESIADWKSVAQDPWFKSLVFPEALRRAALWAATELQNGATEEDSDALRDWCKYFRTRLDTDIAEAVENDEVNDDWADKLTEEFCSRMQLELHWPHLGFDGSEAT